MATPATGQIAISDIIANDGVNIGYGNNLNWVKTYSKDGISDMNSSRSREAYQRNMDGNCNNGNCTQTDCNCGNINCVNCLNCSTINCANCDTQEYFQGNCNCNPTYNCSQSTRSYNCNCDCFVCNCACW